jgi:thiol:disulfide interchange protein DsbC
MTQEITTAVPVRTGPGFKPLAKLAGASRRLLPRLAQAIVMSMVVASAAVHAQAPAPDVLVALQKAYPNTKFRSVTSTIVPGIYEVVMGKTVAYVEGTGRYFLFGNMFDMASQKDLTAPKIAQLTVIDTTTLPVIDAIKMVKGQGRRVLYVFSDPDCPFCKQLEQTLAKLDDVTIYMFPLPLASLHPDAARKADQVWCAPDRAKAWEALMLRNELPANPVRCETPIARNVALAQALDINGTPTLISADGRKQAGALGEATLNAFMAGPTSVVSK